MSTSEQITKEVKTRVAPGDVEAMIVGETYTVLPSGKKVICELTLRNGFTVEGSAGVVDIANFDMELGKKFSRQRALDQVWMLAGYELQTHLHNLRRST